MLLLSAFITIVMMYKSNVDNCHQLLQLLQRLNEQSVLVTPETGTSLADIASK